MTRDEVERVYRDHGDLVLRRARSILGNEADAREVLQELFLSLLDRPDQFGGKSSVITFLYSATTHLCLNTLRNRRTRARLVEQRAVELGGAGSDTAPARSEALAEARQALGRLPSDLAQVAVYYFFDEMTQDEIADVVGCSRRQVGYLLERARGVMANSEART